MFQDKEMDEVLTSIVLPDHDVHPWAAKGLIGTCVQRSIKVLLPRSVSYNAGWKLMSGKSQLMDFQLFVYAAKVIHLVCFMYQPHVIVLKAML